MALSKRSRSVGSVRMLIRHNRKHHRKEQLLSKAVPVLLFTTASISILTTIGIVWTLATETTVFFHHISITHFVTGKEWLPFFRTNAQYGILPLICGTFLVTVIAMMVAVPIGLGCAIYLSEYASDRIRRTVKPLLEILAGIPTIVYGFFALTFVTPMLQTIIPKLQFFNALSPGIVIGIMLIPTIASLSEDAIHAVPSSFREGSLGLGATRFETTVQVVLPSALSGILASIVLAVSRAMGETMIVVIAGGATPVLSLNPMQSIQTLTAYIVQVSLGDAPHGTIAYYSMYAVGSVLFIFTFFMNMAARHIAHRFKGGYS